MYLLLSIYILFYYLHHKIQKSLLKSSIICFLSFNEIEYFNANPRIQSLFYINMHFIRWIYIYMSQYRSKCKKWFKWVWFFPVLSPLPNRFLLHFFSKNVPSWTMIWFLFLKVNFLFTNITSLCYLYSYKYVLYYYIIISIIFLSDQDDYSQIQNWCNDDNYIWSNWYKHPS